MSSAACWPPLQVKSNAVPPTPFSFPIPFSQLTEDAVDALTSLGSAFITRIARRESWAAIGRKGALIGSVPEDHGKGEASGGVTCAYRCPSNILAPT